MEAIGHNRQVLPPSYIGKLIIFFTPEGEIKLITGNQQMKVTLEELKGMLELYAQITAAFEVGSTNGNGAKI